MVDLNQNALAKKLDRLETSYGLFSAETEKPLLRWLTEPGDEEIVNVFVTYEQEAGDVNDIILDIRVPFEDSLDAYSVDIVDELKRQYEEIKPGLEEEGFEMDWFAPPPEGDEPALVTLMRTLESFRTHHAEMSDKLCVFLRPKDVADPGAFARWVNALLVYDPPPKIRFVVLDAKDYPILGKVAEVQAQKVHTEPLGLDYGSVLEELAQGVDDQQGPDAQFRVLFVKLSNQAEKQDVEGAEETAKLALAVAASQKWYQMQVVVHMLLGATHLQIQELDSALQAYRRATKVAREAKEAADPAGPKLEIQALLAEASVVFTKTEYLKAAEIYQETAVLAETEKDHLLTMESWRMAAFCYEMEKQYPAAVHYGQLAMDAGGKMEEADRKQSTLAYVGDGLIRVIETAKKKRKAKDFPAIWEIDERMKGLLGDGWRDNVMVDMNGTTMAQAQGGAPS